MSNSDSTTSSVSKPARRTTRSSIRQSLNLASVGKALADVMNKEGKDSLRRKSSSSSKDTHSRRASTIGFNRVASNLEPVLETKRLNSPDLKTVTKSRRSSLQVAGRMSLDETGVKLADTSIQQQQGVQPSALNRASSVLRPRNAAAGSALPKYRPKSLLVESTFKKTASPTRAGTRRKHSSSEEDGSSASTTTCAFVVHSPMEKASRPISPIPRRTGKSGATPSPGVNGRPTPSPTTKSSKVRESPVTSTPPRPKKTPKPSDSPMTKKTGLPRPSPLDTSRAPSASPQTPTLAKNLSRYLSPSKSGRASPSPSRSNVMNGSPVSSKSRTRIPKGSSENIPTVGTPTTNCFADSSLSAITEGASCDSLEAGDVEFMLAAIASPTAPTPAIPRLRPVNFNQQPPETPSRTFLQPPRSTLGLSLYPSNQKENESERNSSSTSTSRKSSPTRKSVNERSSVAAWEKLADLSAEINASELGGLITEVDAPFLPTTPGMLSPSPSVMRLESEAPPESPTPLNMPSPGGYTSISQVLLPNVTPSPAIPMRNHLYFSDANGGLDVPSMDSATVMLLKLQLASIENLAKGRLAQITRLEEEMHVLKETKRRDEEELSIEVAQLEDRLREALAAPQYQPAEQDHSECLAALEERLRWEDEERQKAVLEAKSQAAEAERTRQERILRRSKNHQEVSTVLQCASRQWTNVGEIVDGELEFIASNRETLAVLRSSLDFFETQIGAMLCIPNA